MSETYYNYKQKGICVRCACKPALLNKVFCSSCLLYTNSKSKSIRDYKKLNKICQDCDEPAAQNRGLCLLCKNRHDNHTKKFCQKLKEEVFIAYGYSCNCCGENNKNFLQIDHIYGITPETKLTGPNLYRYLKKNNFPKYNFQLLCANCNWAKGIYGICPHKENLKTLFASCSQEES